MIGLGLLWACGEEAARDVVEPASEPGAPVLRRLTAAQYADTLEDLVGPGLVLGRVEPDTSLDGFLSVGASVATLSELGVEQYEGNALDVAAVAVDADHRGAWVPCVPAGPIDDACAREALGPWARRAWRRSLTEPEMDALVALASEAGEATGDFHTGLSYAVAAVLQSPWFLYRVELGEDDGAGGRRWTGVEMASRLSFLFWNRGPDDALLDAAEAGRLDAAEGVREEAARLIDDPAFGKGIANFFTELYTLDALDDLSKDPLVFAAMSEDLGPAARTETLLFLEWIVRSGADWRDVLTSSTTFVDRRLAALYGVPAPERDGFGQVVLPASGGRRGLLGHASLLAQFSHPASSSATLRGKFVRSTLLCTPIPPPPAGVDTSIPESSEALPTLRDRVGQHLSDPFCAGCHEITDPIGLGLENFDALGAWRATENDVAIDASGEIDGLAFEDAWTLADAVREHPDFGPCIVDQLVIYGLGRAVNQSEASAREWLADGFADGGYRVEDLMMTFAASELFRQAGP
jgi:hypothetical protein